jgi:imidazole glycerol-phosphate synthase subunit HisF
MIYKRLVPKIVVYRDIADELAQFTSILTRNYEPFRNIGLPLEQIRVLQSNLVDEITIVQVNKHGFDYKFVDLIQKISEIVSTPISVGGFISEWSHASALFKAGADKIILGRSKSNRPLASKISEEYGNQSLLYSLDYSNRNEFEDLILLENCIRYAEDIGFGEIILNNKSLDGSRKGLDLKTLGEALSLTELPITVGCGIGSIHNIFEGFKHGASAVALATFLSQMDQTPRQIRSHLGSLGIHIRMSM